jgi:hypothetical protein
MQKEELTAAQRIMLAKGMGMYEPKPITITISTRTELILVAVIQVVLLTFFIDLLINKVFIKQTSYVFSLIIFIQLVRGNYILKKTWKKYKAEKLNTAAI